VEEDRVWIEELRDNATWANLGSGVPLYGRSNLPPRGTARPVPVADDLLSVRRPNGDLPSRRSDPNGDDVTWRMRAEPGRVDAELVQLLSRRPEIGQRRRTHRPALRPPFEDRTPGQWVLTPAR
jgi:hypothetical protein